MIYVIGIGAGGRASLAVRPLEIIGRAGLIVGGRRHVEEFAGAGAQRAVVGKSLEETASAIEGFVKGSSRRDVAVLATGDPLLFGIGGFIVKRFGKKRVSIIPNVSTVQEAFARIKEDSRGVVVLSAHGRGADLGAIAREAARHEKTAVFTDPENSPARLAKAIIECGGRGGRGGRVTAGLDAYVCESLGTGMERVTRTGLAALARRKSFAPLNILVLIRRDGRPAPEAAVPGIPDALLSHSRGMITKEEVRVIALSKLRLKPDSVVWDIGAGSGSVSVEAARLAPGGAVYAVEKDVKRVRHIERNIKRFGTGNVTVVKGSAPACLKGLPRPDAVFIGGGGAGITEILRGVSENIKNGGRVVVNAIAVETAGRVVDYFKADGWAREVVLVNVSKSKDMGGLNILTAANPVFVISGRRS